MTDHLGPYLLGPNDENQGIYTGDARELAKAIPDESVDLIFTDPVYQNIDDYRWLAETAARVLKPDGDVLIYYAHWFICEVMDALRPNLIVRWPLCERLTGNVGRVWPYQMLCYHRPLFWATKSEPRTGTQNRMDFVIKRSESVFNHKWAKGISGTYQWTNRYSELNAIIFDPFTGGGTVPAVCKMLGRKWLAFEIDPDTAERARERVRMTQPPLFVPEPEQLSLEAME